MTRPTRSKRIASASQALACWLGASVSAANHQEVKNDRALFIYWHELRSDPRKYESPGVLHYRRCFGAASGSILPLLSIPNSSVN